VLDAVLVDSSMPDEDGRWFLRELRASATASASAAVFAVSASEAISPMPRVASPGTS
jgi:DNA-binding response OmpR family regulator